MIWSLFMDAPSISDTYPKHVTLCRRVPALEITRPNMLLCAVWSQITRPNMLLCAVGSQITRPNMLLCAVGSQITRPNMLLCALGSQITRPNMLLCAVGSQRVKHGHQPSSSELSYNMVSDGTRHYTALGPDHSL